MFGFLAQMLTFIMLARLSALSPNAVLQRLERLIEPLRATCSTKVRPGAVPPRWALPRSPGAAPAPRSCWSRSLCRCCQLKTVLWVCR